uniref:Uncharacterized protein n=1 Tax=Trichogramma kaykai TaxID=54128 RepID=A0ABD2XKF7_9HYME
MIPILGETVLSIIHGPVTTGHLVEVSQFLKRPINVWTKHRLLLFGKCHYRHEPRLHLKYKSLTNKCPSCGLSTSSKAVGHFTLLKGEEPRNPDARSHPENCGFDVVSDQTGYPATALRQVAVQRMLAKLYESRLRGRDHHFQCSHCSVSGGAASYKEFLPRAEEIMKISKEDHNGHAHVHIRNYACKGSQCICRVPERFPNTNVIDYRTVECLQKYIEVNQFGDGSTPNTVFADDKGLKISLARVLAVVGEDIVFGCVCENDIEVCSENNITFYPQERKGELVRNLQDLKLKAFSYVPPDFWLNFPVHDVKMVFKCAVDVESKTCIDVINEKKLYLVTAYPLAVRDGFLKCDL